MTQTLTVSLPPATVYVSGTVNSVSVTWTLVGDNLWQAVAERSDTDIYYVALTLITAAGQTSQIDLTLYYGLLNLITDRTPADVETARRLDAAGWARLSAEEKAQWMTQLNGAYTAADLNRVGAAVDYLAGRFTGCGISVPVAPRQDWTDADVPTPAEMDAYLADVRTLRSAISVFPDTPDAPARMYASGPGAGDGLTWAGANDIDQILLDLDLLLDHMAAAWRHSGAVISGMEGLIR